ncbi:MAG: alpha/beta fold hydrolase [Anaerolineae bacterium]|nr:alpha/beta fold hydrolase [Anaerolineae bacterium]
MTSQPLVQIMPGAEPFFLPGGPVGCLCLHGFTASPAEVRWLGEYLAGRGLTVYGPRFAGHGTQPKDLARVHWRDWIASALDGYALLRARCERVVVIGHSMGGLVALALAADYDVDAVVAMAAPIQFGWQAASARWLRYVYPYSDQSDTGGLQDIVRAEQARRAEPVVGRVRYDLWSTAGVAQLYALSRVVDGQLPQITAPLQLIYSKADPTVAAPLADHIAEHVRSAIVERQILEKSGHILPQDVERETVFQLIGHFVETHGGGATLEAKSS